MSRIDYEIPDQRMELIGNKIALILADELNNQFELTGDDIYKCDVWSQRLIPFDKTELPAINVVFNRAVNSDNTPETSKFEYVFNITVGVNSKTSKLMRGDVSTSKKLLKLASVIRFILMNPYYQTLGFDEKFIYTRSIDSIDITSYDSNDGTYTFAMMLDFRVTVEEFNGSASGEIVEEVSSQLMLNETDKGYLIEVN